MLTFDDGPWPGNTPAVLKALADECTTGIFFSIGKHATYYPEILKQVDGGRPHHRHRTPGRTPTLTNKKLTDEQKKDEIEKGFSAVKMGAGRRLAGAVLPLPGAAASAGDGDLSRHPQHRDVLLRPQLLRLQGAQRPSR